jgi:tetratricopeptide (TPR) repeat protein
MRRVQREAAYRSNNLGVARLERFDFAGAAEAFRQALQADAGLTLARINLSIALLHVPDVEGAEREATAAASILPSAPQPHYVLGLIARMTNRTDEALAAFERVRQIDARDVGANVNRGQIYLQQQRYDEAMAAFRAAMAEEPYSVTATYNLGLTMTRRGERDEGLVLMERSQTLRESGYGTILTTSYLEQGRYAEAVASTGTEPGLVDESMPGVTFSAVSIGDSTGDGQPAVSPFGRQFGESDLSPDGMTGIATALAGGVTLLDADGDRDLDLVAVSASGQRLFRNDGGQFVDITAGSGLNASPAGAIGLGAVAGDFDNDGRSDLFVLRYGASSLYRQEANGRFLDVTRQAALPAYSSLPGAAAFVDVDHDGDLDLVRAGLADLGAARANAVGRTLRFPDDFPAAPLQLLRNNGNGTFADITAQARLQATTHAVAIVPTDFDNRRDIDLLVVNHDGPPRLFKNLRDGTFEDVAAQAGLGNPAGAAGAITGVAAADLNKDEYPDFFFGRAGQPGVFALSDGRGRFTTVPGPDASRGTVAAQLFDYDGDGLIDLLTWSDDGAHLLRNLGGRWVDATGPALPPAVRAGTDAANAARMAAVADLDRDGDLDVIGSQGPGLAMWRSDGSRNRSMRVDLVGRVGNRAGVGSKVQVRAGSLFSRAETSSATPAVAPADVLFGLGSRPGADVVRVLWPSGILQAEAADQAGVLSSPLQVEELNRKPSSCPFLFTWNGTRFVFVTDFMGGGEMGYWLAPGVRNTPDPVEYVRITGDQLRARDGRLELRVTNELEEAVFIDRVQLLAIAHPQDVEVFPNEGMTEPPKPIRLFAVSGARPPARVLDDHGHDMTVRVARIDRQYADDFELLPIRGYAQEHTLTIDMGAAAEPPLLLLTGWTDYAFSSDNVAAHQAGLHLRVPSLEVKDDGGRWRTAIADIGIPVGRPQTIVVDLRARVPRGAREVRITTNMRIYWDQILIGAAARSDGLPAARVDPLAATLGARGFSAEVRPGGGEPPVYDYDRASLVSPWKAMAGRYTRLGDVRTLVTSANDMFVIGAPGDEVALSFDAVALPTLPAGWTRTFLLLADGFSKEMDINSASPDAVEPLPFHQMTQYPYSGRERYPATAAHERYRAEFNTRLVPKTVPSVETARRDAASRAR